MKPPGTGWTRGGDASSSVLRLHRPRGPRATFSSFILALADGPQVPSRERTVQVRVRGT